LVHPDAASTRQVRKKGRQIRYSDAELAWLGANRTLPVSDYHGGFCAAFKRSLIITDLEVVL